MKQNMDLLTFAKAIRDGKYRGAESRRIATMVVSSQAQGETADAARWRFFAADNLSYMKTPLINGKTGAPVHGRVQWTIHWDGPDATFFSDAVDTALATNRSEG